MRIPLTIFALLCLWIGSCVYAYADQASHSEDNAVNEWRQPDPDQLLLMRVNGQSIWIELAPQFAPNHVANIKQLVANKYFDGLFVIRSQENYVAQWGDAEQDESKQRSLGKASANIKVEFFRDKTELNYTPLNSRDAYAEQVGFVQGFPVASDGKRAWLAHCNGMVGVSRGMGDDSGNGSGLYVVTGHSPRHLDRNVTLVGRVLSGMSALSSLPRGTGPLGFYESPEEYVPVESVRLGTHADQDFHLEIMRTDSAAFQTHIAQRTTRDEEWFIEPTGRIELCNVGVPSRELEN